VTSLVLQSVQYFVQQFSLQLASVEQHCELNEKSEQVQQANVFKRQTLMFHFAMYRPNSSKHLSHQTPVSLHEGINICDQFFCPQAVSCALWNDFNGNVAMSNVYK